MKLIVDGTNNMYNMAEPNESYLRLRTTYIVKSVKLRSLIC